MTYQEVLYEVDRGVATISLNNPGKMNATTDLMDIEIRSAVEEAGADPQVRAIVITGASAGRAFCAGADMSRLTNLQQGAETPLDPRSVADAQSAGTIENNYKLGLSYMLRVPKPIFAAINGAAAGIGVSLTLFCDFRYMVDTAKLTTVFAPRGLIAEHGQSWMLPRLVGAMNAMDLLFSGRVVTGREAQELGLVRALPAEGFLENVQQIARNMIQNASPRSIAVMKRQIYDDMFQDLNAAIQVMQTEAQLSFASEDFKEGVASFLEKRPPAFTGR